MSQRESTATSVEEGEPAFTGDTLTDTGVIRFQRAAAKSRALFHRHFNERCSCEDCKEGAA